MVVKKNIITVLAILVSIFSAYYYYFVDTLSMSDLVNENSSPTVTIFTNLLDFDTGLTRWDIQHLENKAPYWQKRINQVESITNYEEREKARNILVAEMLKDPSIKKLNQRIFNVMKSSTRTATDILDVVGSLY
ncbi:hypothetical protein [Desulforhopalus singaporensis]|uniref:Uncharacterized protein n=1 Tax=Desulforhopalus singaporensis TaxID=91360 RepID=A0A1H0W5V9_9BACT|nr:hypothetical protein [Desulforhopalus singaporensis]SDP86120.1 hypothetical protein SAMN05660330_04433 [Desulforhopalus singaporensis]